MTGEEYLINEIKKYSCICYYPSSGPDLSNLDYFGSGRKLFGERIGDVQPVYDKLTPVASPGNDPDLFIHTDINFYQEFSAGKDLVPENCGMHGSFKVVEFRELPVIEAPNRICANFDFSGQCFEYKLRLWGSQKIVTLIYCLCENEAFMARVLLSGLIKVSYIWSRNWNGGQTYGTWLVNVLDRLQTQKVYTDWLCVPGSRGEPRNRAVEEKYPELMAADKVKLVRNNDLHWIDEGAHGWVEEFDVVSC
ncbi:MAG: hypothetical protein PHD82_09530 [Candidatus Riflebacteria bacterium]|nr:hypothetical protein [Candidatus Riflebacteria bacterium]